MSDLTNVGIMTPTTLVRGFGLAVLISTCNIAFGQPYVISTIAGGAPPATPATATSASVSLPSGVAADNSGNLYFTSNNSVFRIDSAGTLTRVAGNSRAGYSGDGGPAVNAQLGYPTGVAVDSIGNLYIADPGSHRIRKVVSGTMQSAAGNGFT